jgi:hypothetical protein
MTTQQTQWAWRRAGKVQHLAVVGRGRHDGELATYCNRLWIADHVRPVWTVDDLPHSERRPCLLCVGWLTRNGASWKVLLEWMRAQGAHIRPDTPRPVRLVAV